MNSADLVFSNTENCSEAETRTVYRFRVSLSLFVAGDCGKVSNGIQVDRIKKQAEEGYCVSPLGSNHKHMQQ